MISITTQQLLNTWEQAYGKSLVEQAICLVRLVLPEQSRDTLFKLPIGVRDAWLLTLRQQLNGPYLPFLAVCAHCSEQIEMSLHADQLYLARPQDNPESWIVEDSTGRYKVRLLNSTDQQAILNLPSLEERELELFSRCVTRLSSENSTGATESVAQEIAPTDELIARVSSVLDAADPQANVEIPVTCPVCQFVTTTLFDVVTYLWAEIDVWARRTLNELHLIASTYGWTEDAILALSPTRRQLYVNMVRS